MKPQQQLSRKAIKEFKSIYREEFGRDISDEEAQESGWWLLDFLKVLVEAKADREKISNLKEKITPIVQQRDFGFACTERNDNDQLITKKGIIT